MRYVAGLILLLLLVAGGAFLYAGRLPGPSIDIAKPVKYVGQATPVEVAVTAPGAHVTRLKILFEQNGKQTPLFSLDAPGSADVKQESADRVRVTRVINRESVPDLKSGPARLLVTAARPVMRGFRTVESSTRATSRSAWRGRRSRSCRPSTT